MLAVRVMPFPKNIGVVAEGVAAEERGRGGGGGEGALASSQLWNAVIGGRHRGAAVSAGVVGVGGTGGRTGGGVLAAVAAVAAVVAVAVVAASTVGAIGIGGLEGPRDGGGAYQRASRAGCEGVIAEKSDIRRGHALGLWWM